MKNVLWILSFILSFFHSIHFLFSHPSGFPLISDHPHNIMKMSFFKIIFNIKRQFTNHKIVNIWCRGKSPRPAPWVPETTVTPEDTLGSGSVHGQTLNRQDSREFPVDGAGNTISIHVPSKAYDKI